MIFTQKKYGFKIRLGKFFINYSPFGSNSFLASLDYVKDWFDGIYGSIQR